MLTRRNKQGAEQVAATGGMMDEAGQVVNGVEVPTGSMAEEVADDVPAMLSEGEFVLPADVVRFIGLERLMKMRDKAKEGLERMDEMGQMGNAEEVDNPDQQFDEADDIEFENEIDSIVGEVDKDGAAMQTEQMFAAGGYVTGGDISNAPKNPAVDVRYYKHADGRVMYITHINDKPMTSVPDGFNEVSAEEARQVGKKAEETAPVAAGGAAGAAVGGGGSGGSSDGLPSGEDGGVFGVDGLAATGLGLMAIGEKLENVPTVTGRLASKAATFAGEKIADRAIDKMSDAYNAVAAPPAMPGMGTFAAKDGTISTVSTQDMINKSDMDMFGITGAQMNAGRNAKESASTGMFTNTAGQTVSNNLSIAAQDAANFGVVSTSSGFGSSSEAAQTGMTTTDSGKTVSNDATIAAQNQAMFGDDASTSNSGEGGSSKIVCTAMNESYGFGSFRQSIWLRYSAEHLTKEHEVGYHAMFLPLVKAAYKEQHWYSQSLRSVLEHIARHRTADIRAELRGSKRNRIGQAYRVVLEPLCYIVGKLK